MALKEDILTALTVYGNTLEGELVVSYSNRAELDIMERRVWIDTTAVQGAECEVGNWILTEERAAALDRDMQGLLVEMVAIARKKK